MKKAILVLIIVVIIIAAVAGVFAYLFFSGTFGNHSRFGQRNFQLDQSQIDDVTNFFASNPTTEQIQSYCTNNQTRMNCFYYCRTIDPNYSYCSQMMARMGNFTRGNFKRGNYTGNYTRRQGGPGNIPPMPPTPQ